MVPFQCQGLVIANSKLFFVQLSFAVFGQCQVYKEPLRGGWRWGWMGETQCSVLTDCSDVVTAWKQLLRWRGEAGRSQMRSFY